MGDIHRGGETRSDTLPGKNSLVDHSGIQGQEGEDPSARLEGMLYLEIASDDPPDTLWLTYWEHLLSDAPEVTPGITLPLVGEKGTYFEGSSGTNVFSWGFPEDLESGYFSIANGKTVLIRQWSFFGGNRVRMRIDLKRGNVLFGGPKASFYRTQYLLDQAFGEEKFNSDPILVANRSGGLFTDSASGAAYRKAHSQPEDLHVRMKVLVPEENGWEDLRAYLSHPVSRHPAWEILKMDPTALTKEERARLTSRIQGGLLLTATKKAGRIITQLDSIPAKAKVFLDWAAFASPDKITGSHPLLVQGLTGLETIHARTTGENPMDRLGGYPGPVRDELLGYFLLSNYNRLRENLGPYLTAGLERVSTGWIAERLKDLHDVQLGPFLTEGLYDTAGNPVDWERFGGKTVLVHFWISGCKFCRDDYLSVLSPLEDLLEAEKDILLLTVNADGREDTWKTSLEKEIYTSPSMTNLRAEEGTGVLYRYNIHSFPQKMIIGPDGKVRLQSLDKMGHRQLLHLLEKTQGEQLPDPSFSPTQTD